MSAIRELTISATVLWTLRRNGHCARCIVRPDGAGASIEMLFDESLIVAVSLPLHEALAWAESDRCDLRESGWSPDSERGRLTAAAAS
jgi:hypothetical protein